MSFSSEPGAVVPWDSAQAAYQPQSVRLANEVGVSLTNAHLPTLLGLASLRPLDNLTCPAIALEIAPLKLPRSNLTPPDDEAYQQCIAQATAAALISWRSHNPPPPAKTPRTSAAAAAIP
ncbi:MAG: hypothetical protein NVSMB3_09330 [Acidobacteriaceae bacterium]